MKPKILFSSILICFCSIHLCAQDLIKVLSDAEIQTGVMLKEIDKARLALSNNPQGRKNLNLIYPCSLTPSGDLKLVQADDWRSGFFPGLLWYLYEYTGKQEWMDKARSFTSYIENEKWNSGTHDMGFKVYSSFGNGYRLTSDAAYRDIIIQSAKTLCKRFNPKVGCIRSWDFNKDRWQYPVIIDNMMNLELLFAATRLSGDSSFYKIAVSHANTTLKNHFRPDNSSIHVIDYDTLTGRVLKRNTYQGFSDESAWSRGQAWGLYGYVICYRETKNKIYLAQAEKIAGFILKNPTLPQDLVPYWDYNAPGIPDEPRDVSAAAIAASALYELSTYSPQKKLYQDKADKIIQSLTRQYRSAIGDNKGFILLHSTGSKPGKAEVDLPLNYADYFFVEALLRSKKLKENKKLF